MTVCSIPGCEKIIKAVGLCARHYSSKRKYGDPLKVKTIRPMGSGCLRSDGYWIKSGVLEHVAIAEKVLGRALPPFSEVHHVNGNRSDNAHGNLVICPDKAYHKLLHVRTRALEACGNANWRKCPYCKLHDDVKNMNYSRSKHGIGYFFHMKCKKGTS